MLKITNRKRYTKKQKTDLSLKDDKLDLLGGDEVETSFTGSHVELENVADSLFISPPRPQPLAFSSLSLKPPAKAVPPTPSPALQTKIESNLEKSLSKTLDIQLQQQMGSFQGSKLEAFRSLRELAAKKSQGEVAQTPSSALKPGPSASQDSIARHSDVISHEEMEVDYGPALPPCLASGESQPSKIVASAVKVSAQKVSIKHKKRTHPRKKLISDEGSASDLGHEDLKESRFSLPQPKNTDKSRHKGRSRYYPSSSEEDQSSAPKHRSSRPSGTQ